jgi:uncharacterized protein YbaR (Trm112 family)
MSGLPIAPGAGDAPVCPVCQGELRHIYSGARSGLFGCEMSLFMCSTHGAVYRTREGIEQPDRDGDVSGALTRRPDKPPLTPTSAAAVPQESTQTDSPLLSVRSDCRVEQ